MPRRSRGSVAAALARLDAVRHVVRATLDRA
jgi:hypothetical protein